MKKWVQNKRKVIFDQQHSYVKTTTTYILTVIKFHLINWKFSWFQTILSTICHESLPPKITNCYHYQNTLLFSRWTIAMIVKSQTKFSIVQSSIARSNWKKKIIDYTTEIPIRSSWFPSEQQPLLHNNENERKK